VMDVNSERESVIREGITCEAIAKRDYIDTQFKKKKKKNDST
jgi:hypothetical protein